MNCRNIRSYCKIASLWLPVAPWDVLSTLGTLNTGHIAWPTIQSQVQNPFFMAPFPPLREGNTAIKRMVNTKNENCVIACPVSIQIRMNVFSRHKINEVNQIGTVNWINWFIKYLTRMLLNWASRINSWTLQNKPRRARWKDFQEIFT